MSFIANFISNATFTWTSYYLPLNSLFVPQFYAEVFQTEELVARKQDLKF